MRPALLLTIVGMIWIGAPQALVAEDIFAAAKRGDLLAVQHYLRKDPENLRLADESGHTPLHWAGIRGQWEVFAHLVRAGAPVNSPGGDGGTPLHWACHHDRPDMIRLLLDRDADLSVRNRWGRTALHVAARRGCDLTVALLLSRGADPDTPTHEGWTALHVAYKAAHPRVVRQLLDGGASPEILDGQGNPPNAYYWERPQALPLEPGLLDEYAGRYGEGDRLLAKVWKEEGRLRLLEFAPDDLVPVGPDRFLCRQEPWRVSFQRDAGGQVAGLEIDFLRRTVHGDKLPEFEYIGSKACGACHSAGESGAQYVPWLASRHAHAYWRLAGDWARFVAARGEEYRDVKDPRQDPRCLKCHVTGLQDPEARFAPSYREAEGVGCETCHGPGSAYSDAEIMADQEQFLAHGGRLPGEETCLECHQDGGFLFVERLALISHPRTAAAAP